VRLADPRRAPQFNAERAGLSRPLRRKSLRRRILPRNRRFSRRFDTCCRCSSSAVVWHRWASFSAHFQHTRSRPATRSTRPVRAPVPGSGGVAKSSRRRVTRRPPTRGTAATIKTPRASINNNGSAGRPRPRTATTFLRSSSFPTRRSREPGPTARGSKPCTLRHGNGGSALCISRVSQGSRAKMSSRSRCSRISSSIARCGSSPCRRGSTARRPAGNSWRL
jgi:hypothetical protein